MSAMDEPDIFTLLPNLAMDLRTPPSHDELKAEAAAVEAFIREGGAEKIEGGFRTYMGQENEVTRRGSRRDGLKNGSGRATSKRTFTCTPRKKLAPLSIQANGSLGPMNVLSGCGLLKQSVSVNTVPVTTPTVEANSLKAAISIDRNFGALPEMETKMEVEVMEAPSLSPKALRRQQSGASGRRRAGSGWVATKRRARAALEDCVLLQPLHCAADGTLRPPSPPPATPLAPRTTVDQAPEDAPLEEVPEEEVPMDLVASDGECAVTATEAFAELPDCCTLAAATPDPAPETLTESLATPALPQFWYEGNAAMVASPSADVVEAAPSPGATHVYPSRMQVARAMLTPAQPQYWYEANGSPVESTGAVNGAEEPRVQAVQEKEARRAARMRRRRNQAALLTPAQPQYWYEANSREPCTENTDGASSTPESGCSVSLPPEAARNVSTRKRRKKAALTPAQPQYWYEANRVPANSLSDDTQEQSEDTRNVKDSETSNGRGTPQSTGLAASGSRKKAARSTLRRNSTQSLAPIVESEQEQNAGAGSPIVPTALHFTPQKKRVRFSDSFEMEGPVLKVPASAPPRTRTRAAKEAECAEVSGWQRAGGGAMPTPSKSMGAGEWTPRERSDERRGGGLDEALKDPDEAPQSSAQSQGSAFSAAEEALALEEGTGAEEEGAEQGIDVQTASLIHGAAEAASSNVAGVQDEHASLRLSGLDSFQADFHQDVLYPEQEDVMKNTSPALPCVPVGLKSNGKKRALVPESLPYHSKLFSWCAEDSVPSLVAHLQMIKENSRLLVPAGRPEDTELPAEASPSSPCVLVHEPEAQSQATPSFLTPSAFGSAGHTLVSGPNAQCCYRPTPLSMPPPPQTLSKSPRFVANTPEDASWSPLAVPPFNQNAIDFGHERELAIPDKSPSTVAPTPLGSMRSPGMGCIQQATRMPSPHLRKTPSPDVVSRHLRPGVTPFNTPMPTEKPSSDAASTPEATEPVEGGEQSSVSARFSQLTTKPRLTTPVSACKTTTPTRMARLTPELCLQASHEVHDVGTVTTPCLEAPSSTTRPGLPAVLACQDMATSPMDLHAACHASPIVYKEDVEDPRPSPSMQDDNVDEGPAAINIKIVPTTTSSQPGSILPWKRQCTSSALLPPPLPRTRCSFHRRASIDTSKIVRRMATPSMSHGGASPDAGSSVVSELMRACHRAQQNAFAQPALLGVLSPVCPPSPSNASAAHPDAVDDLHDDHGHEALEPAETEFRPESSGGSAEGCSDMGAVTPRDLFFRDVPEESQIAPCTNMVRFERTQPDLTDTPTSIISSVSLLNRPQPNQNLRKWATKRKSLSGAGLLNLESGLRRSSRQRVRPLEYWRNEKVVYARKYQSLPTVRHVEVHTPDPQWPVPQPKRRKEEIKSMLAR